MGKLVQLTVQEPISWVTRGWGKESDSFWKTSKPRRWWTKWPSWKSTEFRLLLCLRKGETGGGCGSRSGHEQWLLSRHLDTSKGPRRMVILLCFWLANYSCCGPSHNVPINLLINDRYFCTYFHYLLGEVVLSREVVSVILRLQVRFL